VLLILIIGWAGPDDYARAGAHPLARIIDRLRCICPNNVELTTSHCAVASFLSLPPRGGGLRSGGFAQVRLSANVPRSEAPHSDPPRTRGEGIIKCSAFLSSRQLNLFGICPRRSRLDGFGALSGPVRGFAILMPLGPRTAANVGFRRLPAAFLIQFPQLLRA
jgi:hypothetical protein